MKGKNRSELFGRTIRRRLKDQVDRGEDFRRIRQAGKRVNMTEEEAMLLIDKIRNELPMNK